MKKIAVLLLLVSAPVFGFSGNDWRRMQASSDEVERSVVFGFLMGTHSWYKTYGLFGSCANIPEDVTTTQIEKSYSSGWIKTLRKLIFQ